MPKLESKKLNRGPDFFAALSTSMSPSCSSSNWSSYSSSISSSGPASICDEVKSFACSEVVDSPNRLPLVMLKSDLDALDGVGLFARGGGGMK